MRPGPRTQPRPDTPVPGLGDCHPPARPAQIHPLPRRSTSTPRRNCHASKRRVHVLGPPDALAPGRHRPRGLPRQLGRRPGRSPGWTGTRSPPSVYAVTGINPDGTAHYEPIDGLEVHHPLRHRSRPVDQPATPTPSSTTARWARSSKPSWPSRTSNGKPRASWTAAGPSGAWPCSTSPSPCPATTAPTLPYLAITNRHDGTAACALRATAVRIVCANTFRAAELEGERTGTTFSFIHKVQLAQPHRGSPPGRHRRPGRDAPLQPTWPASCWPSPSPPRSGNCSSPSSSPSPPRA